MAAIFFSGFGFLENEEKRQQNPERVFFYLGAEGAESQKKKTNPVTHQMPKTYKIKKN